MQQSGLFGRLEALLNQTGMNTKKRARLASTKQQSFYLRAVGGTSHSEKRDWNGFIHDFMDVGVNEWLMIEWLMSRQRASEMLYETTAAPLLAVPGTPYCSNITATFFAFLSRISHTKETTDSLLIPIIVIPYANCRTV